MKNDFMFQIAIGVICLFAFAITIQLRSVTITGLITPYGAAPGLHSSCAWKKTGLKFI
jgi:hypothetical protein